MNNLTTGLNVMCVWFIQLKNNCTLTHILIFLRRCHINVKEDHRVLLRTFHVNPLSRTFFPICVSLHRTKLKINTHVKAEHKNCGSIPIPKYLIPRLVTHIALRYREEYRCSRYLSILHIWPFGMLLLVYMRIYISFASLEEGEKKETRALG